MSCQKYPNKALFCIYKITFIGTESFYIGSANNSQERIWCHVKMLNKGNHKNRHLQNCYSKYGKSSIRFEILEKDLGDSLRTREQHWIDTLKPNLNIIKDVRGHFGFIPTEETKKKISDKVKALHASGYYKHIYAIRKKRSKNSDETIRKRIESNKKSFALRYKELDEKVLEFIKQEKTPGYILKTLGIKRGTLAGVKKRYNIKHKWKI